ncbi:MAG: 50S ribosomal protein L19 [Spirochaetes bacterium GWF1_31_7]|nr:MAG: 50S ribosomal protein L19 [Spirochaetes bacterium GWE1_32_154]OHD51098.1 MAG: 50S ribosomal protein L19 [Spirochaetes bacterium GWF1_31_7]OHD51790.1 MAG: 50S ribosomal protein L19 [Spirochaetes bacterium GWE2_31_10]OHD79674.1 MAG: 50S ribosomal protein L19 [Spirochaetes bacterium RIFOXYB1_FULL_32_8]
MKGKDPATTKVNLDEVKDNFLSRVGSFDIGDLVKVAVKIVEGKRERIQFFEGYVISFRGHGITKTFKVRKIAFSVGVERTFPMYSPNIDSIEVIRKGRVRRAKLFYLRERSGKKANIVERINYKKANAKAKK